MTVSHVHAPQMTSDVHAPQMTSSNSMSSGYCSLDEESEDFAFFTAKTTFFSQAKQLKKNEAKEEEEGGAKALSKEEVQARVEQYNSGNSTENAMKLSADGSYTGFVKVHMGLSRPVTVPTHHRSTDHEPGPTDHAHLEAAEGAEPQGAGAGRTSFYLPRGCVKQLHISSATTVQEVIQGLLKKYSVLDNPRKFALYRHTQRHDQDLFQKLPLYEHPLSLRLQAGPDPDTLTFVLKENESTEVEWHAFSIPELQNFLVILGKEETERVRAVEHKYASYRQKLQLALRQHDP